MRNRLAVAFLFITVTLAAWGFVLETWSEDDSSIPNDSGWELIRHDLYGFSLEVPSTWYSAIHGESGSQGAREVRFKAASGDRRGPAWVDIYEQSTDSPSIESAAAWGRIIARQKGYRSMPSQSEAIVDNTITLRSSFEKPSGRRLEQVYVHDDTSIFVIQFEVETEHHDAYIDFYDRMVDSFRLDG